MLKITKNIIDDLKNFENIDVYITIIVAIGVAVLGILELPDPQLIGSITLAVLGSLAFTTLMNRHRLETLSQSLKQSTSNFFLREFPMDIMRAQFEQSTEVWLVGVSLYRTITLNYNLIEKKIHQGHKFKIMVVHPNGPGLEMAMVRNYPRKDVEPKTAIIRNTLKLLCDLRNTNPDLVEIRTIQHPLSYGVFAVEPEKASGTLYLEHYTFGISTDSLPRYIIRSSDGEWYDFFKKEIQAMWEYGDEWND